MGYIHPEDKGAKAKRLTEYLCNEEMEVALKKYRDACADAHDLVTEWLKKLAAELEVSSGFNLPVQSPPPLPFLICAYSMTS